MLDVRPAASSAVATAAAARRQALPWLVAAAVALHALLLGSIGSGLAGSAARGATTVAVRVVEAPPAEPAAEAEAAEAAEEATAPPPPLPPPPAPAVRGRPPPALVPRSPAAASSPAAPEPVAAEVPARTDTAAGDLPASAVAVADLARSAAASTPDFAPSAASAFAAASAVASAAASAAADAADAAADPALAAAAASASSSSSPPALRSALLAGDEPPPRYRVRLPPAATLRYEVRRSLLRGTGEIRWAPRDGAYEMRLEASIAGLTLLLQTSTGAIDAGGLAPERFVDQRARRAGVAANFRRNVRGSDAVAAAASASNETTDRITFSGDRAQFALLPGTQDRLSWMIQLAGIAAAEPQLLVEGGRIAMVVAGARGDAALWVLRYAGIEMAETAGGQVRAVKLVRDGRSPYDTSAEVWLDPERSYLPVHATLRNASGSSEYDLLLERIVAPP